MQRSPLNAAFQSRTPIIYRFRTDDVDEAREFVGRRFGDHTRVPRGRGPLGLVLSVRSGQRCLTGYQEAALTSTVRAVSRAVLVHLPLQRGATYRVGRHTLHSSPDVAVLLAPGHDYSTTGAAGAAGAALMIDAELLASEIESSAPSSTGPWSLRSVELPLSPDQRTAFKELTRRHAAAVSVAAHSLDFSTLLQVERQLAGWLAGRITQCGAMRPLSTSSRRAAELAEAWIRQHAPQPISLEQLAAVAGVSARTLQKASLARWGQTPLELVAARRLELVREGLSSGTGALSVTEAAVRAGFTHLGRFAALYRRVFGESPSDTLAQARDNSRGVARAAAD